MNAALSGNNRWGNGYDDRREAMANGSYRPVERIVTYVQPTTETAEQRKARLAAATGTSRSLWK